MRILLTGGTGFIGSHFLLQALAAKHQILAIRRTAGSKVKIELQVQPEWLETRLDQTLVSQLKGCDTLVHLAAHTANVPYDSIQKCMYWNVTAVLNLPQCQES